VIGNANRSAPCLTTHTPADRSGDFRKNSKRATGSNDGTTGNVVIPSFSNAFMIGVCEFASFPKNPVVCCHSRSREM